MLMLGFLRVLKGVLIWKFVIIWRVDNNSNKKEKEWRRINEGKLGY